MSQPQTRFALTHLTLAVTKMPEMKKFYEGVFEISLQPVEMYGARLYQGQLGDLGLLLCPNEIAQARAEQNRHQLRFSVDDIVLLMQRALANGGTLLNETTDQPGGKISAVRDPDGNSIEFMQAEN